MEGKLMAAIYEHAKRQVLVNGSDVISSECDNLCQLLKMAQVLALTGEKEYAIQYLRGGDGRIPRSDGPAGHLRAGWHRRSAQGPQRGH